MRAIVLAGGTGSRLFPLTKITNKHLLPISDRPMISWAIEAVVKAGVDEIMLVTGGTHAGEFLRLLGNGHEFGVSLLTYAYQEKPRGIAEALSLGRRFAQDEPVMVMLADNIFEHSLAESVAAFQKKPEGARLVLSKIDDIEHLKHLGVAEIKGDKIVNIVEKPHDPPSCYAVTGVYFYDPNVFDQVALLKPSSRGELEITDVNNYYVSINQVSYDIVDGFWGDAGESIEQYWAVNDFVRANGANL